MANNRGWGFNRKPLINSYTNFGNGNFANVAAEPKYLTDNDLIELFLPIINAGLLADGFKDVIVKQSNQPTQQGINVGPTVFFYMVHKKRYGWLGRWDRSIGGALIHTERQWYETRFQISALVLQYPSSPGYTASDLVDEVASIMQSDNTRAILNQSGVGILRVQDEPNPYFVDDRDNFEASPSFDFTLVYSNDRVGTTPPITPPIVLNIHRI